MGLTGWSREDDEHVKATMGHGRAEQRGGNGNGRRREKDEKNIIYYTRDFPN